MSITTVPETTDPSRRRARTRPAARLWIILSSLAISGYFVGQYATGTLQSLAANHVGLAANYADRGLFLLIAFYSHIVFAGLALAIGPFSFVQRIRDRHPRVHRLLGRVYVVCVLLGAVAGLIMATVNTAGISGFFGFGALAVLWGWFTVTAHRAIRRRDVRAHRAWMMRSFALTYAAVTLRLWFGILIGAQIPLALGTDATFTDLLMQAYAPLPYLCWIPNLVVAEWLIRRRGLPALRMTDGG